MPSHLGPLRVEVFAPESEKFTAPLLLVHGLWSDPTVWRRFAGYFAHRGWRCHAVECVGDDPRERAAALRAAVAAFEAAPVIVGHDLGAALALSCGGMARAVVALAPLIAPPSAAIAAALASAGGWLARRRGAPLSAPGGRWQEVYADTAGVEPAALVRAVAAGELPGAEIPNGVPVAVFGGEADPLLEPAALRAFAEPIGAEAVLLRGAGHALLNGPGWEDRVAAVHRWLIQRLGVDLLALYDEAWEGRDREP